MNRLIKGSSASKVVARVLTRHRTVRYGTVLFFITLLFARGVMAETLNVAVASNFAYTLKQLSADFTRQTGHRLRISSASTGKLFTQIEHGAPFDVFLAADEKRPDLLVKASRASADSAFVYAQGQLVLMSNLKMDQNCQSVLSSGALKRLSIANPKTAPYGAAAKQVLERLDLWQQLQPRLVKGENIAQTLQFVSTGNAEAGFVAKSMLVMKNSPEYACVWDVPADMYRAINQKMVLLNNARNKAAAKAFIEFIRSDKAKDIIKANGYDVL